MVANHPEEDFAKFGQRSERKAEKVRNSATFWQHAGTYCLNLAISKKTIPSNLVTLDHFFKKKSFV
jgi:hypothetical protein